MYFDDACNKMGNGARVLFISPMGKTFKYLFFLMFEYTKNVVEYEALLIDLNIAIKHKIRNLAVYGDSELVTSQVRGKYSSKNKRLKQYRNVVWDDIELFDAFSINWIHMSKNIMADFLANIALKRDDITLASITEVESKPHLLSHITSVVGKSLTMT